MISRFQHMAEEATQIDSQGRERELFLKYLPLVNATVQRIKAGLPSHVETEDLISAAMVGLLDAIRRYDPSKEETFGSFVSMKVKCAVLNELRGRDFLSRAVRKKGRLVELEYERLQNELGREPTSQEVAEALNMSPEELEEVERLNSISLFSLYEVKGLEGKDAPIQVFRDDREELEEHIYMEQLYWPLVEALKSLDEKERLVLSLYYVEELTMKEISQVLRLTESRISQIHTKAIRKLRAKLRAKGLI